MADKTLGTIAREAFVAHPGTILSGWEVVAAAVVREFLKRRAACVTCQGIGRVWTAHDDDDGFVDCPACSLPEGV